MIDKSRLFKMAWKQIKSGCYDMAMGKNIYKKLSWALKDAYRKLKAEQPKIELAVCPVCGSQLKSETQKDAILSGHVGYKKMKMITFQYCPNCDCQEYGKAV